ncbi:MAG: hypothetical protein ACHQZS_10390 [Candidatus Binatales bacterium]
MLRSSLFMAGLNDRQFSVTVLRLLRTSASISAFVIVASGSLLAQTATRSTPPGWKAYVDRVHGFSFAYPPIYKRIRRPGIGVDWLDREEDLDKVAAEGRWVGLLHQRSDAGIYFLLKDTRFDLDSFAAQHAPTGVEGPPSPVKAGGNTFYVYGSGGGGAQYPDQVFFNLKGKTLYIVFDGPYDGRSPTRETEQIESEMLASFRTF